MLSNSPLIITGMHRSATSLTAAILQRAGVSIGDRLLGVECDPRNGHSEDVAFLDLHQLVLADNGLNTDGWTLASEINWSEDRAREARRLVDDRRALATWGWKDPRTVLMLPFWNALLPDAKLLFVFRSPWAVADSLFRRGDVELLRQPALALEIWLHYNTLLLAFMERVPQQCLLVSADRVVEDPDDFVALTSARFGLNLSRSVRGVVDHSLFEMDAADPVRVRAVERLCPAALAVYDQLNRAAGRSAPALGAWTAGPAQEDDPHAVLERWVSACRAGRAP